MNQITKTRRTIAIAFTALVVLASSTMSFAKPTNNAKANSKVELSKAENVQWKITKDFSKATYISDNRRTEVFYDKNDNLIGKSVYVDMKELPSEGARAIDADYNGYATKSAIKYTDAEDNTNYYVEMENEKLNIVLQINADGDVTLLKSTRK